MSEQSKIERVAKKIIFFGLMLLLFLPLIQNITHFKKHIYALDGAFYPESDIDFSWENWFNGDYSAQKDKFVKENFGLHNYYVRLICQLNFSLFKKANAAYVVIGKENYLYESAYIDAYYGRDFIGQEKINKYVTKLKDIQNYFEKQNKLIVVALAPGKACYYPEFIPDNYKSKKSTTNYEGFINSLNKYKVNNLDFYKYFIEQKPKSKYPLYPPLGIHWSNYGSVMAFDSLVKYTENKLNYNLPDITINSVDVPDTLRPTDDDAVKSLNLYKDPKSIKMAYPNWSIKYDSTQHKKLNLLVISDSFWWYIYSTDLPGNVFASSSFWYYNEQVYPESYKSPLFVSQTDYAARIKKADVIVIMHAEATLHKFGGGFVEMCHEALFNPGTREERIKDIKERIKGTESWYNSILEAAKSSGISGDSALTLNAIYMLDQEKNK